MLNILRASVSTLILATFIAAPVTMIVTADYAYAKNGNSGGKGNGGGKGGDGGGKGNSGGKGGDGGGKGGDSGSKGKGNKGGHGKSADKGGKGWGTDKGNRGWGQKNGNGTRSAKSNNGDRGKKGGKDFTQSVKNDFRTLRNDLRNSDLGRLLRGNKGNRAQKEQRGVSRSVSTRRTGTVTASARPKARFDRGAVSALHPSQLGKLNGAINSSPNAKIAHLNNGQWATGSGPVSLAANLAAMDALFSDAMGPDNTLDAGQVKEISEAYQLVETSPVKDTYEAILADPDMYTPEEVEQAEAYEAALDLTEAYDEPTDEQLAAAEGVHTSEDNLLGHYKGTFSEDTDDAEQEREAVLTSVRDSNPDEETVKAILDLEPSEDESAPLEDTETETADDTTDEDRSAQVDNETRQVEEDLASVQ